MLDKFFRNQVLVGPMRKYVMDKVKKPLMKAITISAKDYPKHKRSLERATIILAKRYPEPTRENCIQPNVYKLFDIRDKFFEDFVFEDEFERKVFGAIFKLLIVEYEHDPYYRFRIDWAIEYAVAMGWDSKLSLEYNLSILIAIRDKFFEYERNDGRKPLFEAGWKILIFEYGHGSNRYIDWMLEQIEKSDWKPRPRIPMECWTEFGKLRMRPPDWSALVPLEEPLGSVFIQSQREGE